MQKKNTTTRKTHTARKLRATKKQTPRRCSARARQNKHATRRQHSPLESIADQLEALIGAETTSKEYRATLSHALCAYIRQLIDLNTPASAELARAVYLAGVEAWDRNRREVTGRVEGHTHIFDLQDKRESLTRHQHTILVNTVESERPRFCEVRYSIRHAGKTPILVETNDALETCGIGRGDTVYLDVMDSERDHQPGDIVGSYWCESGVPGWQAFIGRIEVRGGALVVVNDLGERILQPGELCRITAVEKLIGRAKGALEEAAEEWPDIVGEGGVR